MNELRRIQAAIDVLVNGSRKASGRVASGEKITQTIWDGIISIDDPEEMTEEEIKDKRWNLKEYAAIVRLKSKIDETESYKGLDLSGIHFDEIYTTSPNFAGTNMRNTTGVLIVEHGGNFHGADFSGSNLTLYLHKSLCRDAKFVNCRGLKDSSFEGCNLTDADFSGADLSRARLRGAILTGIKYNSQTKWPKGFTPPPSS